MSIGGSKSSSKSTTNATSTTNANSNTKSQGENDPWDYSIPYLQDFLREVGAVGGTGLTPDQKSAYSFLKGNAMEGNPWDTQIAGLATDLFNTADRSGQVNDAYGMLSGQLGDVASGKFLDPMQNPQIMDMLKVVGDNARSSVNQQFAAAGRDLSGLNQRRVTQGMTEAQLPILIDQYNKERANQMGAAEALYNAGTGAATTAANLDQQRAALRSSGVGMGEEALKARDYGANQILNLDQQIKQTPYEDLGMLASLLFPVAGLGGQQAGNSDTKSSSTTNSSSTTKGSSSTIGGSLKLFSDERLKEAKERIGYLDDGTPVFRFRYLGSDETHMGVMAQDIEEHSPEAVSHTEDGFKMIDMRAATERAASFARMEA